MKNVLADVQQKLHDGAYKNEEHVRLSLVARILAELGWNVWDPAEVCAEWQPVPSEDSTRVDFALFLRPGSPSAFIEVKAVGKMDTEKAERQLRDYNRDNTAPFSIITDGRLWRFYYSQTGGKFSDKCFTTLDILEDDLEDVEEALLKFLSKSEIQNGNAEVAAKKYLKRTQIEVIMGECLPKARTASQEPPYPSLPDALVEQVAEEDFTITREQAEEFLKTTSDKKPMTPPARATLPTSPTKPSGPTAPEEGEAFNPDAPPDLKHAKVLSASFDGRPASKWNTLTCVSIEVAHKRGVAFAELQRIMTNTNLKEGEYSDGGFKPVGNTGISVQNVESRRAWQCALSVAKHLNVEVSVSFRWRNKEGAARPGQAGVLRWSPNA